MKIITSIITGQESKAFDFSNSSKVNQQNQFAPENIDTYSSTSENQPVSLKLDSLIKGKLHTSGK